MTTSTDIPSRDELRALLTQYFTGAITDAVVDRVDKRLREIVATASRRQTEDATFRANSVRMVGQAWKEELSRGQSVPRVIDLIPWIAVTSEESLTPRPYTPPQLVGTWEQVEPRGGRWTFEADGSFATDLPRLADCKSWCVHRHSDQGLRGDEVFLREPDETDFEPLHIDEASSGTLTLTVVGGSVENQRFRLRRAGKRARTSEEMRFAASLEPCPKCGTHALGELELRGQDETWVYSGHCPTCGAVRSFQFHTAGDPHATPPVPFELGPGASTLLSADQFLGELARVTPLIGADPRSLAPPEWRASLEALTLALTCANELRKLLPAGAAAIPGTTDPRARRPWLDQEHARLQGLLARYVADKERNAAAARAGKPAPQGTMNREALLAHQRWLKSRSGAGRIDLAHLKLAGLKLGAAELTAAKIVDTDLTGAGFGHITLDEAELVDVKLDRADLDGARLQRVHATGGSWTWAKMAVTRFDGAQIKGTDFTNSDLERATWNDARVEGATFAKVRFGNATFDGAVFTKCDLHTARFARIQRLPEPTSKGTRFEDCDLRDTEWQGRDLAGTTFVRCKLAGAHGAPTATDGLVVKDCDVSLEQLLKQLT